MIDADILGGYAERVYGYAVRRTYTRDEADELAQEILFTAVKELPRLRDEGRFEPWLWGIAGNVTKTFRRSMGKQRAMYSYDTLESLTCEDTLSDSDAELCARLREKLAGLSAIYRELIILYYYDGLSVRQISEKLGLPEGTVTWRLSEGRSRLKKECTEMDETALRPVKLKLDIYGSGNYDGKKIPFPDVYINDALSQNILYHCYEESRSVEELAKLCGVPAYYVEERLANLLRREAVAQPVKGRFRTDFIIWSDKYGVYCEENAERLLLPIADRMLSALAGLSRSAYETDFYKAGKSEAELAYLFGVIAFAHMSEKFCPLTYPPIKTRYDGYRWRYVGNMETGAHQRIGLGVQQCLNMCGRGSYLHRTYHFGGFGFRKMMYDSQINVCEDILTSGRIDDEISAAEAIKDGYIRRLENGELFVTTPAFTKAHLERFESAAEEALSPLMDEYSRIVTDFAAGYKKLFPKHLEDDAQRMCQSFFFSMYSYFVSYGQRTGAYERPAPGSVCDVLIQFK